MENMILYVKSYCGWCHQAEAYLDECGYKYEKIDVLEDREAYARMRTISGQSLTPTLEVGGEVLADFDTRQLERFIERHGLKP